MSEQASQQKLFVLYIGGRHPKARIEVHDLRVIAAKSLEETHAPLRAGWWGDPAGFHIDAWGVLEGSDGHRITLEATPQISEDRLYFVNLGGYHLDDFTEQHKNVFVVAPTENKAKVRALKQVREWKSFHRDNLFDIESMVDLSGDLATNGLYIHLTPAEVEIPFTFACEYITLGA